MWVYRVDVHVILLELLYPESCLYMDMLYNLYNPNNPKYFCIFMMITRFKSIKKHMSLLLKTKSINA